MNDMWHIITTEVPTDHSETIAQIMYELGCNGCLEDKSEKEGIAKLTSYFDANLFEKTPLMDDIRNVISQQIPSSNLDMNISTSSVADWSKNWRQWFRPFEIVEDITVAPSWENFTPDEGKQVITLDPGMAFGTGLHATTMLCAKGIEKLSRTQIEPSLLDVGTGSGLLAIVARKLGLKDIMTVEIDPEAIRVAKENFSINKTDDIEVADSISMIDRSFDVVVANILLLTLIKLKEDLIRVTKPQGILILSGITHDQESSIEEAFAGSMNLRDINQLNEWSSITFEKKR
ncbi:MAG: 50S ribosomal protein L11 methyltransferase [Deltaproteobacteria bacterium]|jgi:ribosomal protein L11 methyltransferase|nr:50S ribosomal protein L11 methyltransferase [Deltaproteobacteria bacterium]